MGQHVSRAKITDPGSVLGTDRELAGLDRRAAGAHEAAPALPIGVLDDACVVTDPGCYRTRKYCLSLRATARVPGGVP
jgi:hypothetical protein